MSSSYARRLGVYRREGRSVLIEVRLRELRQLFNTLDPAPFHEKDLDPAAEEYLVGAVREVGSQRTKLVLYLPSGSSDEEACTLVNAVRNYFTYRARHTSEQLRLLLTRGAISFAIGLAFLFGCLSLRQFINALTVESSVLSEGLLILGWVAMWRPVEVFLYEWWPALGTRRLYARIAAMEIDTRPNEPPRAEHA